MDKKSLEVRSGANTRKGYTTHEKQESGSAVLYLCAPSLAAAFLWATEPILVYEIGKEITN